MPPSLKHLQATDPIEAIERALREQGGVVVEGLLDRDVLARLNAEIDPLLDAVSPERKFLNPALDWFFGNRTREFG